MIGDLSYLRRQIRGIMDFYEPTSIDRNLGGYFQAFRDDGTICDLTTRHLAGTCRFIYNFAAAAMVLDEPRYLEGARHGLAFLQAHHRQADGGYAWVLDGHDVVDPHRHAYGHAFILLAAATAAKAGIDDARPLVEDLFDLIEARFRESAAGLYVDVIGPGNWSAIDPYRGQNANMHMCEAMLAAYETTRASKYLDRAHSLARRICLDLAKPSQGLIWEHYHTDWTHDWTYNVSDPKHLFRPFGYLPGHFLEWTKLLLLLNRHRPEPWMTERAAGLFDAAIDRGWDGARGGFNYTFGRNGAVLDADRYYWVHAEAIAAAALLALESGRTDCWRWYETFWTYCDRNFIDHEHGGWFRVLDAAGRKLSDLKSPPAKTDYHPLSACWVALEAVTARDARRKET